METSMSLQQCNNIQSISFLSAGHLIITLLITIYINKSIQPNSFVLTTYLANQTDLTQIFRVHVSVQKCYMLNFWVQRVHCCIYKLLCCRPKKKPLLTFHCFVHIYFYNGLAPGHGSHAAIRVPRRPLTSQQCYSRSLYSYVDKMRLHTQNIFLFWFLLNNWLLCISFKPLLTLTKNTYWW